MKDKIAVAGATVAFVATVWVANWLVKHYGPVRVWPTDLKAPAGVYAIGLAFVLRDFVQYRGSRLLAVCAICVGIAASYFVSPALAEASALAFAFSEVAGLLVFWALQGRSVLLALVAAGAVAALIDSYVFLQVAFHSQEFFAGQFVAKVSLSLLAVPIVLGVRMAFPRPSLA